MSQENNETQTKDVSNAFNLADFANLDNDVIDSSKQIIKGEVNTNIETPSNLPAEILTPINQERLVDVNTLPQDKLVLAQKMALSINFNETTSTITFIEKSLEPLAHVSRELLEDTKISDMGEVGKIAASVIDGIAILRIEDLQNEVKDISPKTNGFFTKVFSLGKVAGSAIQSFSENRKKFLTLMDKEEAKARKTKADLMITIQKLDEQALAVRQGVSNLTVCVAAAQIALDDGYKQAEELRQKALTSRNPGDAAVALDYRNALTNFKGRVADIREAMVSSATLIPVIALNKKASETRVSKLSNSIMLTIPRLNALASQAAVQASIKRAGKESEKLDEANRKIMELVAQGTHDAAIESARSLAGDPNSLEDLAKFAEQSISTMKEVIQIEKDVSKEQNEREQKLIKIRNDLVNGMLQVQTETLSKPLSQ
jgi:uncharacterized protein YaaN involved in tellurite resistance